MAQLLDKPEPQTPTREATSKRLSREEIAQIELGNTAIAPRTALGLVLGFLLTILILPVGEHLKSLHRWKTTPDATLSSTLPGIYGVRNLLPDASLIRGARTWKETVALLPSTEQIKAFETSLEEQSASARWLIPRVQWLLTTLGGVGNEKAITGRDSWLFYRPSVEYVLAEPFLDGRRIAKLRRSERRDADPIPAIVQLHQQLQERGIQLLVVPTPGKVQIHPEKLIGIDPSWEGVLQNPSYASFIERLSAEGVSIYDPGPLLLRRKRDGAAQFLETDTHWTPAGMEAVAGEIAEQMKAILPPGAASRFSRQRKHVSNLGDIAVMLKLPASQRIYRPRDVVIGAVRVDEAPWSRTAGAPVLLLGDSFSNIYSQSELGWGEGAGLPEQISFELGLPVDRIVINAGGAHATRQRLATELARDPDRLNGVRVVIWQFAQRELLAGDWKPISLPESGSEKPIIEQRVERRVTVSGRIRAIGQAPRPGSVPYRDCLVAIHLDDLQGIDGSIADPEVLVFIHGMRDNHRTEAAGWSVGQRVQLTLTPWDRAPKRVHSTQQAMTNTDADLWVTSWWYAPRPNDPPETKEEKP